MLFYVIKFKPFKNKWNQWLEVFNELCILSLQYCMISMTEITTDLKTKSTTGWALIIIVFVNFGVNCAFIVVNMFIDICQKVR